MGSFPTRDEFCQMKLGQTFVKNAMNCHSHENDFDDDDYEPKKGNPHLLNLFWENVLIYSFSFLPKSEVLVLSCWRGKYYSYTLNAYLSYTSYKLLLIHSLIMIQVDIMIQKAVLEILLQQTNLSHLK